MRTLVTAVLVALLATAVAASAAGPASKPSLKEDSDKLVLENEHVTVWFQGKKPMLKVFPTAAGAVATEGEATTSLLLGNASLAYDYHFTDVIEYRDLDGDLVPDANEIVARLNLNAASDWVVERTEEEGVVVLNLTLEAPVKIGAKTALPTDNLTLPDRTARVGLVFTIRSEETVLDAAGVNVTVPVTAVKYDFVVEKWPFVDAGGNRLALEMLTSGQVALANETGVESAQVVANGTAVGALGWITTAQGVTTDGAEVDVPVRTATVAEADGQTRLVFTYDFEDLVAFVHDPTIGVAPEAEEIAQAGAGPVGSVKDVPAGGLLAATAGLAVAAYAMRRRG